MNKVKTFKLSAVIACYNDEQAIPEMYERLIKAFNKINCDYEIIFVNDGSLDNSTETIKKICNQDKNVIGIIHSRNFNSQNAFSSGMLNSSGDAVVLLDGDLQDPPELIEKFTELWNEGNDVVYGIRKWRQTNFILKSFYKLFYRIFNRLADINIPHDAGEFSLMDRKVVNEINLLPEKDRFIRGLRAWVGFKQIGIDYSRPKRKFGKSTNNFFKNVRWARKGIFSFSLLPLEFIFYFAYFIVSLSAILIFLYGFAYFFSEEIPDKFTLFFISVLFLGGIQILSISILSEYIGKILEETKNRPKFIIKEIINKKKNN